MKSILLAARRFLRPPSPPRQFPTTGFRLLDSSVLVEEERQPFYSSTSFYPVRIGQVLNSRYQVVGKLGYGGYSTVWLCRDLVEHQYIALKLCRSDAPQVKREIDAYRHLNTIKAKHTGASPVRTMLDSFDLLENQQIYPCIVHKPLGISLAKFWTKVKRNKLPENVLKLVLIHILIALDFLHAKANIIHADLQEKNILLGVDDCSVLDDFERQEHENPTPRKIDGERIIYESRSLNNTKIPGRPVLTDFGEALLGSNTCMHTGLIQPAQYRAPEVFLEMPWNEKVDIWNVGVMIWDLFEDKNMFKIRDSAKEPSKLHHLAHMVALLGPPPVDVLQDSSIASEYFNSDGSWRGAIDLPNINLEESECNLNGENKALFLTFVRKMLRWRPEERRSARDLLRDPRLRDGDQFADCE
ncbi:MAG: hypothetical protein M1829_002986 [Trizodia sp. TS-e1964]|nr:MAG: hypothetical protein M1829_002986 [Trizodia sp. TS-e1964]